MISFLFFSAFLFSQSLAAPAPDKNYPVPNPTNGTCQYDGLTMGDPYDPTAYYQCCQHIWFLKYCPEGDVFNKYKLICVPNMDPPLPTPTRRHFFSETPELTTLTTTTSTQICVSGDKQKNPFDDSKFDECIDGTHWETKSCSQGALFNPNTKQCQYVPTTSACTYGDTRPMSNGNPSNYLFCNGNSWEIRQCWQGYIYDQYLKQCIQKYTTKRYIPTRYPYTHRPFISSSTEQPIPDGSCQESMGQDGYKPNPQNCRTYFQCVHGKWQLRDCGPGTQWVQSILGCDYYNGTC